jgi:hypothetical protein
LLTASICLLGIIFLLRRFFRPVGSQRKLGNVGSVEYRHRGLKNILRVRKVDNPVAIPPDQFRLLAEGCLSKKEGQRRVGDSCPLRRTAITHALNQGLSYRQVQMMSGRRDPKTVMRYDHDRENPDQNAINFLSHEQPTQRKS